MPSFRVILIFNLLMLLSVSVRRTTLPSQCRLGGHGSSHPSQRSEHSVARIREL